MPFSSGELKSFPRIWDYFIVIHGPQQHTDGLVFCYERIKLQKSGRHETWKGRASQVCTTESKARKFDLNLPSENMSPLYWILFIFYIDRWKFPPTTSPVTSPARWAKSMGGGGGGLVHHDWWLFLNKFSILSLPWEHRGIEDMDGASCMVSLKNRIFSEFLAKIENNFLKYSLISLELLCSSPWTLWFIDVLYSSRMMQRIYQLIMYKWFHLCCYSNRLSKWNDSL